MVSKISIYFLYISACLTGGLIAGIYFSNKEAGWGDFSYPMTVYTRDGYEVIPRSKYLLYVLLAMLVIILVVLCLSILMNIFFKNMYANVLFGLGLFALADLLQAAGLNMGLLYPIKFVDFASVLSGETAIQIDQSSIDYRYMMIWLIVSVLALMVILFGQNRHSFHGNVLFYL